MKMKIAKPKPVTTTAFEYYRGYLVDCLRPHLKTIASKLVCKARCRTSWQASQSFFAAQLAAGPLGRPVKYKPDKE